MVMIVLRNKDFVEKSEDYDDKFVVPMPFPINPEWVKAGYSLKIEIDDDSKSYQRDYNTRKMSEVWRKDIKKVRHSLKEGFIYNDKDPKERTHYYPKDSGPKRYYVSKDINPTDRLMYDLHAPKLYTDKETGETYIQIKVALLFCSGHTKRDGKKFSEIED